MSPIAHTVASYGLEQQSYADDTQLYVANSYLNHDTALLRLTECLSVLHKWFCYNGLPLNLDKTNVIILGITWRPKSRASVPLSNIVKFLGVTLDKTFMLNTHISAISISCFFSHSCTSSYLASLNRCSARIIACSLVGCWLDYANSVLSGVCKEYSATPTYPKPFSWSCYSPKWPYQHITDTQGSAMVASQMKYQIQSCNSDEPSYLFSWIAISIPCPHSNSLALESGQFFCQELRLVPENSATLHRQYGATFHLTYVLPCQHIPLTIWTPN